MMKRHVSGWLVGGLLSMAVVGVALNSNAVANASAGTEPGAVSNMKMQQEKSTSVKEEKGQESQKPCDDVTGKTATATDGMQSSEKQQQCGEMMKNADMQKMMQQMMAGDPAVKDMRKSMISADDSEQNTTAATAQDHKAHHSS